MPKNKIDVEPENQNETIRIDKKPVKNYSLYVFIILVILIGIVFGVKEYMYRSSAVNRIVLDQLITTGNGLYQNPDSVSSLDAKYIFKGKNVDNYVIMDNVCFRIIHITQNKLLKVLYYGNAENGSCTKQTSTQSAWDSGEEGYEKSTIYNLLKQYETGNRIEFSAIDFNSDYSLIAQVNFNVGSISKDLLTNIKGNEREEKEKLLTSKIGLLSATDYLNAGLTCHFGAFASTEDCSKDNYLYTNENYWTMSGDAGDIKNAWLVKDKGNVVYASKSAKHNVYPVMYLKETIKLEGNGTKENPYLVIK